MFSKLSLPSQQDKTLAAELARLLAAGDVDGAIKVLGINQPQ